MTHQRRFPAGAPEYPALDKNMVCHSIRVMRQNGAFIRKLRRSSLTISLAASLLILCFMVCLARAMISSICSSVISFPLVRGVSSADRSFVFFGMTVPRQECVSPRHFGVGKDCSSHTPYCLKRIGISPGGLKEHGINSGGSFDGCSAKQSVKSDR